MKKIICCFTVLCLFNSNISNVGSFHETSSHDNQNYTIVEYIIQEDMIIPFGLEISGNAYNHIFIANLPTRTLTDGTSIYTMASIILSLTAYWAWPYGVAAGIATKIMSELRGRQSTKTVIKAYCNEVHIH